MPRQRQTPPGPTGAARPAAQIPHLGDPAAFLAALCGRRPALFLDYDGTLTPLASHPAQALLSDEMRQLLAGLARRVPVSIVSGRDRGDLERMVAVPGLFYAGSHGLDIRGPGLCNQVGMSARPALDAAEHQLRAQLAGVNGVLIEPKYLSLAVHDRHVDPGQVAAVRAAVHAVAAAHGELRVLTGQCIHELVPAVPWHKGVAVRWLLERLAPDCVPVYLGDDLTDEDAFAALAGQGLTILVGRPDRSSLARLRLRDTGEVRDLLARLLEHICAA
jgi:trehalose 6-phosphate phosphatase